MGGFRIDGCGVSDHFKHLKSLGMYSCPACKKLAEFTLDEANQKIDVFYIPTLTLKTRYAVMCKRCENGEFCSSEWAGYLMNQTATPEIIFESVAKERGWSPEAGAFRREALQQFEPTGQEQSASQPEPTGQERPASQPEPTGQERLASQTELTGQEQPALQSEPMRAKEPSQSAGAAGGIAPTFFKCAYCGVTQMREGNFCAYCGKPAPAAEPPEREAEAEKDEKICPHCGNKQDIGGKFCFRCGKKLIAEPAVERKCSYCGAMVKDGALFCMECGSKV